MIKIVSTRNQIVTEAKRRLAAVYRDSKMTHGLAPATVSTYNQFFIFDLPDALSLQANRTRGMYEAAFPLSISYWCQADPDEIMFIANEHMERIQLALELDERFAGDDRKGLCIRYFLDERALIWYDEGVVDVEMMYVFEYTKDAGWVRNPFAPQTRR